MNRRRLALVLGSSLVLLVAGGYAAFAAIDRTASYRVDGFRFEGPLGLEPEVGHIRVEGALGRRDPPFVVCPMSEQGIRNLNRDACEPLRVGEYAGLLWERRGFAPGHGARDHDLTVFVPELGAGVHVGYRARDDAFLDRADAWLCRRWARTVLDTLEWDPDGG